MKIKNVEGMTLGQVEAEIERGGKFVYYQYCVSLLVLTFRRPSNIYLVRAGQSDILPGLGFTILSALLGWWGIPWGFIYTPMVLFNNLRGGKDVTEEVLHDMRMRLVGAAKPEATELHSTQS
ncbi:hypothetical protein [Solirubrum puertoriconensis]|uniref:hypothetical protein n=1 Tax=Solirubrum puertoriconensis TaxID=1751427 RepID=UPI001C1F9CA2|nr:hypothetical protein [Solirubrum puertoriconensis]